jgi:hypothetical protein
MRRLRGLPKSKSFSEFHIKVKRRYRASLKPRYKPIIIVTGTLGNSYYQKTWRFGGLCKKIWLITPKLKRPVLKLPKI